MQSTLVLNIQQGLIGGKRPSANLAVEVLIDGVSVGHGAEFDIGLILAYGSQAAEALDIFTCGCGNAGCYGIFEECRMSVTDTEHLWHIPESVAKLIWATPPAATNSEVVLRFDRKAYAVELARALKEANARAKRMKGKCRVLLFGLDSADDPSETFAAQIKDRRARRLAWDEGIAYRLRVWGDHRNASLVLTPLDDGPVEVNVEWLAQALAKQAGARDDTEVAVKVESTFAPQLRAGVAEAEAAARLLGWLDIQSVAEFGYSGNAGGAWPEGVTARMQVQE